MHRKFILFLSFVIIFLPLQNVSAQDNFSVAGKEINIYFFWGTGCPHCEKEKPFLAKLAQKYPQVKIIDYEVWGNSQNRNLLVEFGKKLDVNVSGVPFTVIGNQYFIGWLDESYTGAQVEEALRCALENGCRDIGKEFLAPEQNENADRVQKEILGMPKKLNLPLIGEIETKNFSLPTLTIILGALDGFNPCAMWTLLFLISLLLGMESKKRMWVLGSAFIVVSALVYFLFMAAWLNFMLFIGMVIWVRLIVGLVALAGGGYNFKEYFTNKEGACKVTGSEKRQKIFEKLKNIAHQKSFYLALGGIIILAFAVNLVELICSAGIPAVYTQILSLNNLSSGQYYLYLFFYIFVFMLDDLIVFFAAMLTLRMTGITAKYSRLSHLIGGILMLIIGLLLIFKPEWLMFG